MAARTTPRRGVACAACTFCKYIHYGGPNRESTKSDVAFFVRNYPAAAEALVAYYDSTYPGVNGILCRALVPPNAKVLHALAEAREGMGCMTLRARWLRRHAKVMALVAFLLLFPIVLSPTHPIAVYSYLATYYSPLGETSGFASVDELREFLMSDDQIRRYKVDLKGDVGDPNTGKLFVVVRSHDGKLEHRSVRTWNEFLPQALPFAVSSHLDRKEIPFLGDIVEAYSSSARIEAEGHYHAYGGPPSGGDQLAGRIVRLPEVVVANGIFPMVYLRGTILDYGAVSPSGDLIKATSRLDESLQAGAVAYESVPGVASETTKSSLSYLRNRRGVNVDSLNEVRAEVMVLCDEFESDYGGLFAEDINVYRRENWDLYQFVHNIYVLDSWAEYGLYREGWNLAAWNDGKAVARGDVE